MELVGIYSSDKMVGTINTFGYSSDIVPWYLNFDEEYRWSKMWVIFGPDKWELHNNVCFTFGESNLALWYIHKKSKRCIDMDSVSSYRHFIVDRFNLDVQPNFILKCQEDLEFLNVFMLLDTQELTDLDKFVNRLKQSSKDKFILSLTGE